MGNIFFISVHNSGLEFAREVKRRITDAGFLGWLMDDIGGGDGWKAEVDNAINESLGVLVIVSPASLASHWVTYEWAYAMGRDKEVIPVILEWPSGKADPKSLHDKLADRQYRDFSPNGDSPWDILLSDLRRIRDRSDIPDQIKRAEETLQSGHDPEQWQNAVNMLRTHPHPQATEALVRCMESPVSFVSAHSAMTLAKKSKCQDKRAIPGLGRALKSVEWLITGSEQKEIAELLAEYGTEDAINSVIDALKSGLFEEHHMDKDPFVEIISRFDYEGVIDSMIDALTSNHPVIVNRATSTLGRIRDPRALPALHKLLVESNLVSQRIRAANAIGVIANSSSVGTLVEILRKFELENVRNRPKESDVVESIAQALVQIGTEEALSGLEGIVKDHSVDRFVRLIVQKVLTNRN
ncbi:MAG: TIR domain-containing protein [Anaerolineae bacterium]|nr:TIR domain-containing protein [Anaerolineae bacterium]